MDILLKPDELCLSGSMNHFVISTRNEITFVLGDAGTGTAIVRHTYTPNKWIWKTSSRPCSPSS